MKVIVNLADEKETRLEGDCPIFGKGRDYKEGYDKRLDNIGFWLNDWKYAGHSGPPHKSQVFIPWGSALYIEELETEAGERHD